ncbi:MAG: LacI family DNA-binding transcriptional regulator [Stappiaceae bacterium]
MDMVSKQPKSSRVTIQQVAQAAGVDRSTVSRVYNRPELLQHETIEKVKSVAKRLGYSPNSAARALRTGRNENIALVVPDLTNPFMPPVALAVQKEASKQGYCVFIGNADEDPSQEEDLLSRFSDQVSGAVLASPRSDPSVIQAMARNIPLVLINRDIAGVPRVLIDSGQGMAKAVAHLADLGHSGITYVSGPTLSWANEQRKAAVSQAAEIYSLKFSVVDAGTASFLSGSQVVSKLLETDASAYIAFDDVLAQGICHGLAERDFVIPDDYSVIGCDDILGYSPLTTVSSQAARAGRLAVEMLMASLKSHQVSDVCKVLETDLVLRDTVGAPKINK